ncbi:MAG TPA: SdrD B-like domain-containing protein [Candidatus Saccharimonadales bacterium]|nr:SdrD B-like domain-containing protein [Candidatus Saccharimonadales bacterium]
MPKNFLPILACFLMVFQLLAPAGKVLAQAAPSPSPSDQPSESPSPSDNPSSPSPSVSPSPDSDSVTICHATASNSNPYVQESPNIKNDGSLTGGHLNHTGPLYPADNWGDIIPPYISGDFNYPGLNWPEGQDIWNNQCNIPSPNPSPSNNPSNSPSASPSPRGGNSGSTITGVKFLDENANGEKNDGEENLSGWTIFIDSNGNGTLDQGETSTITSGNGYSFTNLSPGTYTICEVQQDGWNVSQPKTNCQTVVITEAGSYTADFGNYQKAHIVVTKEVVNPTGGDVEDTSTQFDFNIRQSEEIISGGSFSLTDGQSTDPITVDPGTYNVNEVLGSNNYSFDGCTAQYDNESVGTPVESGEQVTLDSGDTVTVTCTNKQKGTVNGYKWNDVNGNGQRCISDFEIPLTHISLDDIPVVGDLPFICEAGLANWTIFVDLNQNGEFDQGEPSATTDENGNYTLVINPGTYTICEVMQDGWEQTYPKNVQDGVLCHQVTFGENETSVDNINFGNRHIAPEITISKTNNKLGTTVAPGDAITYTITLTVEDNSATDVKVVDLLPEGIKYQSGSWSATKNGSDFPVSEPTYASPGTWSLGGLNVGDVVVLTLLASVNANQQPGLYKDVAWGQGTAPDSSTVLAQAVAPGVLDTNFVGTEANVVTSSQNSASVNIQNNVLGASTSQVLGASTSLPGTGASTIWTILAALVLIFGTAMIIVGIKMRRKNV